ncbi:hypothetical protein [Bacillus taeanensis]|uniref:Uncharacterized protein n=1 Tax=Bacillus taeanensis TaxID=273032 RepID=A0A366Y4P5_9BACI|nr:hypothetical protein [Bacillus taeanensis]RBW71383.1 hypothetical protein DS031_01140 [Bacillus taeanensis]
MNIIQEAKRCWFYICKDSDQKTHIKRVISFQVGKHPGKITMQISGTSNQLSFSVPALDSYLIISTEEQIKKQNVHYLYEIIKIFVKNTQKAYTHTKIVNKSQDEVIQQIDRILDRYNDYLILYELFHDQKYKRKANKLLKRIKEINFCLPS